MRRLSAELRGAGRPAYEGPPGIDDEEVSGEWTLDLARAAPAGRPLISKAGATKLCDPVQVRGFCAVGHVRTLTYACTSRRCTHKVCRRHALRERQKLLRPLAMDAFPGVWGVIVLTYAPEVRPKLKDRGVLRAARRAAALLVEGQLLAANGLSQAAGWRLGIVSVDHPEGDTTPGEWKPHHNLLFPQLAFGPHGERAELRWMLTVAELAALRRAWRWLQETITRAPLGREADVWYQWRKGARKKGHALKYFPRTFPGWPASAQRLSYCGAFGARRIHQLEEVARTERPEGEDAPGPLTCLVCQSPLVRVEGPHVPKHFRSCDGQDPPPTGAGP